MKKVVKFGLLVFSVGILGACSNKENETKISEQQKTIESLESKVKDLEKEQASMANSEDGEPFILSGKVVVGEDIKVGGYDINPANESGGSFYLFNKAEDVDNQDAEEADIVIITDEKHSVQSYSLRKGNVLVITGNLKFTKVR